MVKIQKGFTIIELIVVIVILGILAAVAFPKFQDLSGSAQLAVVNGAAAALKSAAVITFAKNQGSLSSASAIAAQVDSENVTISTAGGCTAVTITYTGSSPVVSTTVNLNAVGSYCI